MTPLVEIAAGVFGKVEFQHPSGSLKHRSIPGFLEARRASGELRWKQPIIVHSAGAAAVTTAWSGARLGSPVHAIVPRSTAPGVLALLRWLGAEHHLVASKDAPRVSAELAQTHAAFILDQFAEPELVDHYRPVAAELCEQLAGVDAVLAGVGTGVSITGIGRELRRLRPGCLVIGVEPAECRLASGAPWSPHRIAGLAPPRPRPLLDRGVVDDFVAVSSEDAWARAQRLARDTGLLCGPSAGATVAAALQVREARRARNVVAILGGSISELLGSEH